MAERPALLDPIDKLLVISLAGPLLLVLVWLRVRLLFTLDVDVLSVATLLRAHLLGWVGLLLLAASVLAAVRTTRLGFFARASVLVGMGLLTFVELASVSLYRTSHTVLDASLLLYAIGNLSEMLMVLSTVANPVFSALAIGAVIAALAGALKFAERFSTPEPGPLAPRAIAAVAGAGLLGVLLSAWMPHPAPIQRSLGRAVPMNLLLTTWSHNFEDLPEVPSAYATPVVTPRGPERPNLVVIGLESTRARSLTVYDPSIPTTPRLAALAQNSLVVERAYANFGHTTKAWVAMWCSHHPVPQMKVEESEIGGLPVPCLPDLLEPHGYTNVFFTSATEKFEGKDQLAANLGFDTFFSAERGLDPEGYERANYFGWEDAILLPPSDVWLSENGQQPFVAFYMTGTPHHDYLAPSKRYGRHDFDPEPERNLYLNSVRYLDHFVEELIDQYKQHGLYDNTVFLLVGDHGEGLGEHFKKYHNDCLYEECVRVPFILHAPGRVDPGRWDVQADQLDIVPTALDAMGFTIAGVDGRSALDKSPQKTTFISCWYDRQCIASVRDGMKLIHFFDDIPDALYDLKADPDEQRDLGRQRPEVTAERRAELVNWYRTTKARYRAFRGGK